MKIYLASESPRRRQLLNQAGIAHTVIPSGADENVTEPMEPGALVELLALRKAEMIRDVVPEPGIIIAADTVVYLEKRILGKPVDEEDAFSMLCALQGKKHTVYTGVALLNTAEHKRKIFFEKTDVFFRLLDSEAVWRYIHTGEPMDKAGAYGIQERGAALVTRVEGDFYTVMGLPVARLVMELEEWTSLSPV